MAARTPCYLDLAATPRLRWSSTDHLALSLPAQDAILAVVIDRVMAIAQGAT